MLHLDLALIPLGCDINQRMIEAMIDEVAHENSKDCGKAHWENHNLP